MMYLQRINRVSGEAYADASHSYFTAVRDVLTGDPTAAQAMVDRVALLRDLAYYETAAPRLWAILNQSII